eukprot:CAMPEP_0194294424 /NCGR_PEP_ID=MMETSP0169-20130528/50612_1 /TAXON_ID=218684 /ORGANISM="Corethron pennatum, Strain L29A3" /LENGTH=107 /DNA_ID=CAMNT_0039043273 /DNA_START=561 /DNA_END=884 /DNA_ORIENTATION=-
MVASVSPSTAGGGWTPGGGVAGTELPTPRIMKRRFMTDPESLLGTFRSLSGEALSPKDARLFFPTAEVPPSTEAGGDTIGRASPGLHIFFTICSSSFQVSEESICCK